MNPQEKRAYEIFEEWAKGKNLEIRDCKRKGKGYDYETEDASGKKTTYEVKGSKHENAIPDLHENEVVNGKHLKADFLFVVGNVLKEGKEVIYLIPRHVLKPDNFRLNPRTYRIVYFQNKKVMGELGVHVRNAEKL